MSRFLILADGDFGPMTSKTANSVIRYRPDQVVAVLDRRQAGRTVQDVLGFGGDTPVVGSMAEGLVHQPTAVLVGIAPQGGRLPEEWRNWLAEALDAGCDFLTLGQYLMPSATMADHYLPVVRYVPPEEFALLGQAAKNMGFRQVASEPFVRSSYHAREMAEMF